MYSYLISNKFIYDGYRNWTKHNENETPYQEFKETFNNFSFLFCFSKELDMDAMCYSFFSFGFTMRLVNRAYSIEGTDGHTSLSDKKENLFQYAPVIKFGIKFYLTKMKNASI